MGHFAFRNMVWEDVEAAACYIDGLPESPVEKVELENIRVTFAEDAKPFVPAMHEFAEPTCRMGLYLNNVTEVIIQNVTLEGTEGEPVIAKQCGAVTLKEFNA